jgi:hypothetical protein
MINNSVTLENILKNNREKSNTQRRNEVRDARNDKSEQNYNAVLNSLRRFVLQKNNVNNEYPITKPQVIKHHARAKRALLRDGMFLPEVLRSEKRKKFEMSLKSIKVSDTLKFTGVNQTVYSGDKVKILYSLKTLVDAIKGTLSFPFAGAPPPSLGIATTIAQQIVASHNPTLFPLDFNNFRVKSDQGEVMIRYYPVAPFNNSPTSKYIEWTYIPDPEIAMLLANFTSIGNFTEFDFKSQISIATNQKVSAALIGMLLGNVDSQQAVRAMIDAKYPSRLWNSSGLKNVAQDPYIKSNNFSSNYAGSKSSRIESFLKSMDDLFVSVLKGEFRQEDVSKLIDEIASRPDMYALDAQKEVINKLRQPLIRESNKVNALLTNGGLNNYDKRVVAVSKDAVDLIALTAHANALLNHRCAIRSTKGENIGVVLPKLAQPLDFSSPNIPWPTKAPFTPLVARGALSEATFHLLQYCLWNGKHILLKKQNGSNGNFIEWITTHLQAPQDVGINEIRIFKTCTTTKIQKLLKLIPKYFQKSLIEILKQQLQHAIQVDNTNDFVKVHEWFSRIYDFRLVRY